MTDHRPTYGTMRKRKQKTDRDTRIIEGLQWKLSDCQTIRDITNYHRKNQDQTQTNTYNGATNNNNNKRITALEPSAATAKRGINPLRHALFMLSSTHYEELYK